MANGTVSGPRRPVARKQLLTGIQKEQIRLRRANGETLKALAEEYSVSVGLIHRVANLAPD